MRFLGGGKKRRESLLLRLARIGLSLVVVICVFVCCVSCGAYRNHKLLCLPVLRYCVVLRGASFSLFCSQSCSQLICVFFCVVLLRRVFFLSALVSSCCVAVALYFSAVRRCDCICRDILNCPLNFSVILFICICYCGLCS